MSGSDASEARTDCQSPKARQTLLLKMSEKLNSALSQKRVQAASNKKKDLAYILPHANISSQKLLAFWPNLSTKNILQKSISKAAGEQNYDRINQKLFERQSTSSWIDVCSNDVKS